MESKLNQAIEAVKASSIAYSKFLSANDTKKTKNNQSGYLLGKKSWPMFLDKEPKKGDNAKLSITIKWQDDFETDSVFTYYGKKKNEFRVTSFGKKFPFREEDNVGDLFILTKIDKTYFKAFILSHDEDIESFFESFNISPTETNDIIPKQIPQIGSLELSKCFSNFIKTLAVEFPPTIELAKRARSCYNDVFLITEKIAKTNPDREILNWVDAEFKLFKSIENDRYLKRIQTPFKTVEELISIANTILNRRKNRAGKSLEHHLSEIFTISKLTFSSQAVTEDNKKPDFLFPGAEEYGNPNFDESRITILAAKTTCKDRWRQILNEGDRVKTKHLFTLQQGISSNQLAEMIKYNVCLVVPRPYLKSFPKNFRDKILTLGDFIKKTYIKQNKSL